MSASTIDRWRASRRAFLKLVGTAAIPFGATACAEPGGVRVPRVTLVTGSAGSDWDRIGSAIASRTNAAFGGQPITAMPGAGGISNPARVGRMPGDFGIAFLPFLRLARDGSPPYPEAFPRLVHVASLITNAFHLIVSPQLGLRTLDDIRERKIGVRVGTGPAGSGEEFLLRASLERHGISYDDIRRWGGRIDLLGSGERADLFRDYHVDLITFNSNAPSAIITELALSRAGQFMSLTAEVRADLERTWHVRPVTMPAATYAGQTADVATVGMTSAIFTTDDMADVLVRALVTAVARDKTYLETVHVGFRRWQPADMAESDGLPLHRAAALEYRTRGWSVA
jgi:hypothetical protein